jgi:integrase
MPRPRKGSIVEREVEVKGKNGKIRKKIVLYARVTYKEGSKRKDIWKRAENRTQANEIIKDLLRSLDERGAGVVEASKMTFAQLADYYKDKYLIEPSYVEGRKIAGMRSHKIAALFLDNLREHFDTYRVKAITYGEIEKYKSKRLKTPTRKDTQRKISSVNRELQLLRRVLNVAVREGWINRNPFSFGDSLINVADEIKRKRVLSLEEESLLLTACDDPKREHLKAIIICALDTGMRKGEIFKLEWGDVDFEKRIITVQAFNTKTMTERQIAMTSRLENELKKIWKELAWVREIKEKGGILDAQIERAYKMVFGLTDIKHSFTTACNIAGITDLHFHDLRRTFNTRLAPYMAQTEIMRLTGHTQVQTNFRYVGVEDSMLYRAASVLDEIQRKNSLNRQEKHIN